MVRCESRSKMLRACRCILPDGHAGDHECDGLKVLPSGVETVSGYFRLTHGRHSWDHARPEGR